MTLVVTLERAVGGGHNSDARTSQIFFVWPRRMVHKTSRENFAVAAEPSKGEHTCRHAMEIAFIVSHFKSKFETFDFRKRARNRSESNSVASWVSAAPVSLLQNVSRILIKVADTFRLTENRQCLTSSAKVESAIGTNVKYRQRLRTSKGVQLHQRKVQQHCTSNWNLRPSRLPERGQQDLDGIKS